MEHHEKRAILVLESPWEMYKSDANRSSVLPFIEGIAKMTGDTEVYHANFYDKNSFKQALNCLCRTRFNSTTIYIAAHGNKNTVGGVKIVDVLHLIGMKSREYNITGIMFGTCLVGGNTTAMEVFVEGTNLKWCAGYSSTSTWFEGTLIDCAILASMSKLDSEDFSDESILIDRFVQALAPFSNTFEIGKDCKKYLVCLEDSMQFVIQPSGQGKHAKTVSSDVFETKKEYEMCI
ncbi:hypothetical protein [Crenothrix sp.]|uniref:hypothetical protein n=1 Tax=Crenothrix sp. TaxID=3100433 RepID=UPI00374CC615